MATFTKKELQRYVLWAGALTGFGVLCLLATAMVKANPNGFWYEYWQGFRMAGWLSLFTGAAWLGLAGLHLWTHVFADDVPMTPDQFGKVIGVTVVGTAVLIFVVLHMIPETLASQLPAEVRDAVMRQANGFRIFCVMAVVAIGLTLASASCRRFFRR